MKGNGRFRLIPQVMLLFAVGVLLTGVITYLTQRNISNESIRQEVEQIARELSDEVTLSIKEYPAYEWLLSYWYNHPDEMDIEYDAEFVAGTKTEEKCRILSEHYPELQLRYAETAEIEAMTLEDQKRYAEIAYSWLNTRVDQIKNTSRVAYLFCVVADETYRSQFFLFSAAEPGASRGKGPEDAYVLGMTVSVGDNREDAMRGAELHLSQLTDEGTSMDYYTWLADVEGHPVFLGMTYILADVQEAVASETRKETLNAMLYQVFLSILCLLLIYRFVLRPIEIIRNSVRLYQQTKDSQAVTESLQAVRARNEIGELSYAVTSLAKEMDDHISETASITAEKERIGTELDLATRIQADMLPHVFPPFPEKPEIDLYASMDPAKEVGGDFYDFFLVDDDHLCLVMADVSGKGVPAALMMMVTRILLQTYAMQGITPAEILSKTNQAICANNPEEMFVTIWLGILEISTGKLTAANAGHEYPVLKTPDGSFELFKDRHGFVVGGMENTKYRDYELTLAPGAKLFVYTDGVPEATDGKDQLFGTDRMLTALNRAVDKSPEHILISVRTAVDSFVKKAEQFDDLTMLCLEYKGKQEEEPA